MNLFATAAAFFLGLVIQPSFASDGAGYSNLYRELHHPFLVIQNEIVAQRTAISIPALLEVHSVCASERAYFGLGIARGLL